jgi:hypothetical protein
MEETSRLRAAAELAPRGSGGRGGGRGAGHRAEKEEEAHGRTGDIAWGVRDARGTQRGGDAMRRVEASAAPSWKQRGRCFADGYKRLLGEGKEERMSGTQGA